MSQKCKSYSEFKIFCYLLLGDISDIITIERESCRFTDLSRLILIPTYNGNISIVHWIVGQTLSNQWNFEYTLTILFILSCHWTIQATISNQWTVRQNIVQPIVTFWLILCILWTQFVWRKAIPLKAILAMLAIF